MSRRDDEADLYLVIGTVEPAGTGAIVVTGTDERHEEHRIMLDLYTMDLQVLCDLIKACLKERLRRAKMERT